MRVVITGGAGFIGSHIVDRLLARGDEVCVIDNFATGRRSNLPTDNAKLVTVEGTIADSALVNKVIGDCRPDVVVHAAAAYKDPDNWLEDARTNIVGTINVTKAAKDANVAKLIYFQTALCYGLHPKEQPITLNHPIQPEGSSYAYSKTAGEQYIELSGINYTTFRLANAYGPRNLSGPLPTFYQRLTTGKPCFVMDTRRDFIFVDDVVDVVMLSIDGKGGAGAYHVSSGGDMSIEELFNATTAALRITLDQPVEVRPRNPDDAFTILLDPSRTNQDFNWRAKTPLQDGVTAAIDWYRQNELTETYTHLNLPKEAAPVPVAGASA